MITKDELVKQLDTFQEKLNGIAEPAWEETKTRDYIKSVLGEAYWQQKTALVYKVGDSGDKIFFRAEMDATESDKTIKHVCGHNAHMAALMAAYLFFKENHPQDNIIYFVFQPSQEGYPSGALYISEHCRDIKQCRAGFSIHVWPSYKKGEFHDIDLAACDYFEITITGKSTHLQYEPPQKHEDAIAVAGTIAQRINAHKENDFILYIGRINGGETPTAFNATVKLTGDIRAKDESGRLAAYRRLREVIDTVEEESNNIIINIDYFMGSPKFESNRELKSILNKIVPIKNEKKTYGFGGTDDFPLYSVPGVTLQMGTGMKEELHTPQFFVPVDITKLIFETWIKIGGEFRFKKKR